MLAVAKVGQGQVEQEPDVGIVEGVVDHPSIASVADNARRTEQSKGVRHRGLRSADGLADVTDAKLARFEQRMEDPGSSRITEQLEQVGELHGLLIIQSLPDGGHLPGVDFLNFTGIIRQTVRYLHKRTGICLRVRDVGSNR